MKAEIKIGDKVETINGNAFEITALPGCSVAFPDDWRGIDHTDGLYGLISYSQISNINGVPVKEAEKAMKTTQWSGPKDGLPPVGSVMEFTPSPDFYDPYPVDQWVHGDEIDILAHVDKKGRKIPVAYNRRHQTASTLVAECIQPARTEKERVVEAARDFFTSRRFCPNDHDLGAAYDAGFLKMPESDQ